MSVAATTDIREQAAQRFAQLGWPSTQLEEWKYTNVAPISRVDWRFSESGGGAAALRNEFINGRGATNATAHPLFAKYADYMRHPFVALNTANAQDGALIVIPDGQVVEELIHLRFLGEGDGIWSHPRNLIVVGRNAQVKIIEEYTGKGGYFTNAVTEIVAGEGAVIDHTRLQCESPEAFHVSTVQIHQERSSSVTARTIAFGSLLSRLETNVALKGEGASALLDGLFVLAGRQHVDNQTLIDHARPHCDSVELYKGILDQSARGIFDGRIIVRPDAVKTNSRQVNHNLLLSETAIIDSKPTLEIHNDDVKCNHGSTIGQLDEEAMFYLRSRGIGERDARNLLVYAFASEIVDRIKTDAVREQVRRAMFAHMPERLPERRAGAR
jgi:Fe-S cluster assembly protein SufD